MRKHFLALALIFPIIGFSQTKTVKLKPKFQSLAGAGFVAGQFEPSYQWQLVNGFRIDNWFAGIGAGVDNYRFRTVPLFVSVRRDNLFNRSFFAFADAGVTIPSVSDDEKQPGSSIDKFYTGFYSETGLGYAFPSKRKMSFRLAMGYSFRTMREKAEFFSPSSFWPSSNTVFEYNYKFHLITLKGIVAFSSRK